MAHINPESTTYTPPQPRTFTERLIYFCLTNPFLVTVLTFFIVLWGIIVAPFDWDIPFLPRSPVGVDAIPDIGENQQIVFTEWPGRSPQDVENQVTYPLTTALLGIPGVKTIRSFSMQGFSSIYIIFEESREFYWTRSRILEKLASLPPGTLPEGVKPSLGPDATGLGQIFWYTLEGRDPDGNPIGGWNLQELRTIQDFYVRYALYAAEGVSEVASVGGYVLEYQIDVDPDALRAHNVTLDEIFSAVQNSNLDVGAREIEINRVEYVVRGLGFVKRLEDLEQIVVKTTQNVPIRIKDVAHVTTGPAYRRGVLDKGGAEVVGGVVVARYRSNPLAVIKNVKDRLRNLAPSLPTKPVILWDRTSPEEVERFARAEALPYPMDTAEKEAAWLAWLRQHPRETWMSWLTTSRVTVVPFYDRTGLIYETLGTLNDAILLEILVTLLVILVMARHVQSALIISSALPLAVLLCFITMRHAGVDANIVSLSGIAIAIGTIVDMGIVLLENTLQHMQRAPKDEPRLHIVYRAATEVGSAVFTAVSTTIVGFLPVFTMIGPEGKLFRPLAFTKTFALAASLIVALTIVPTLALYFLFPPKKPGLIRVAAALLVAVSGLTFAIVHSLWLGAILGLIALYLSFRPLLAESFQRVTRFLTNTGIILLTVCILTLWWLPLGPDRGMRTNIVFVLFIVGGWLLFYEVFRWTYPTALRFVLRHKFVYLSLVAFVVFLGLSVWLGFGRLTAWLPEAVKQTNAYSRLYHALPGLGREFMPALDEGSFLYMPSAMPHASLGAALEMLSTQDSLLAQIPEVDTVVGKIGRVESPLDPAPIGMVETIINYKPEYKLDENGRRMYFKYNEETHTFERDAQGNLIPDRWGRPFRQWRDHIRTPDDIWQEIVKAGAYPGATGAPKLQPIATRLVMLQTGMRAPMGIKIHGPDLDTIERVGYEIERLLKQVPSVEPASVVADRIVGKPYLEIEIDREAISRYGLSIRDVQEVIELAVGGERLTTTVEGRERYPVRVRFLREIRDSIEALERIIIPTPEGAQIPLNHIADIRYVRGPEMIKSEDTFLTGYVLFDKKPQYAEVDVVEQCRRFLEQARARGEWHLPPGVTYTFAGTYENQVRAQRTLSIVVPLSLFIIWVILYLQFRSTPITAFVFSGVIVAGAGGFLMIGLYGTDWFGNLSWGDINLRTLFQIHPINLSVAIWVGFLALFGIATDDGVVIATYIQQRMKESPPGTVSEIRERVLEAGVRRIRPCLMTTATTVLALLPVLTSTGRGAEIMLPMAIPSFGGMTLELLTLFLVPVLYSLYEELRLRFRNTTKANA